MDYRVDNQVDLGPGPGFANNELNDPGQGTYFLSDSVSPSYSGFRNSSTPRYTQDKQKHMSSCSIICECLWQHHL